MIQDSLSSFCRCGPKGELGGAGGIWFPGQGVTWAPIGAASVTFQMLIRKVGLWGMIPGVCVCAGGWGHILELALQPLMTEADP